jgi:hypothetical protein
MLVMDSRKITIIWEKILCALKKVEIETGLLAIAHNLAKMTN